jgi:hypothetical protein
MRITVSHNRKKEQVIQAVDRSFDELFRGIGILPLEIADEKRNWTGPTLAFSFTAKMGVLSTPIKGTVAVTDVDVTIDADLGLLERLLGTRAGTAALENKVKGLLT